MCAKSGEASGLDQLIVEVQAAANWIQLIKIGSRFLASQQIDSPDYCSREIADFIAATFLSIKDAEQLDNLPKNIAGKQNLENLEQTSLGTEKLAKSPGGSSDDGKAEKLLNYLAGVQLESKEILVLWRQILAQSELNWTARFAVKDARHVPLKSGQKPWFVLALYLRACRVPLQHLTGRMFFGPLTLASSPGALVVRPETEYLYLKASEILSAADKNRPLQVADLCTGSGALGLALASDFHYLNVYLADISAAALLLASQNLQRLDSSNPKKKISQRVRLALLDATNSGSLQATLPQKIDLIVTNPPYLPSESVEQSEALADPPIALYGDLNESNEQKRILAALEANGAERQLPPGALIPVGVIAASRQILASGATVLMEHDPTQSEFLVRCAHSLGFSAATTLSDLTGRPRFLQATW